LIGQAELRNTTEGAEELGVFAEDYEDAVSKLHVDLRAVNQRVLELANAQSRDIKTRMEKEGINIVIGKGRLLSEDQVEITSEQDGSTSQIHADAVLISTGASPRELPTAKPDGQRILNWKQLYS